MKTLITPTEALRRAFRGDERPAPDTLTEADVAVAEQRYLRPILGSALHDRLLGGENRPFVVDFLADPLALLTRLVAQPRLALLHSRIGLLTPDGDEAKAADETTRRALMCDLRTQARTLLGRAVEQLAQNPTDFPDYDPYQNCLNRCSTDGGLVQIV